MSQILEQIRAELRANADEKTIGNYQHFFKETVKFYGVSLGTVDKIANNYWKEIKSQEKQEIFNLCEDLFRSDYSEEAAVASCWTPKLTNKYELPTWLYLKGGLTLISMTGQSATVSVIILSATLWISIRKVSMRLSAGLNHTTDG